MRTRIRTKVNTCIYSTSKHLLPGYKQVQIELNKLQNEREHEEQRNRGFRESSQIAKFTGRYPKHTKKIKVTREDRCEQDVNVPIFSF